MGDYLLTALLIWPFTVFKRYRLSSVDNWFTLNFIDLKISWPAFSDSEIWRYITNIHKILKPCTSFQKADLV